MSEREEGGTEKEEKEKTRRKRGNEKKERKREERGMTEKIENDFSYITST